MPCMSDGPRCDNEDHVIERERAVRVACELARVLRETGGPRWAERLTAMARAWIADHEKFDAARIAENKARRERRLAELREEVRKLEQDEG